MFFGHRHVEHKELLEVRESRDGDREAFAVVRCNRT